MSSPFLDTRNKGFNAHSSNLVRIPDRQRCGSFMSRYVFEIFGLEKPCSQVPLGTC